MRWRTASDAWTAEAEARFRDLFGPPVETFLVWNGTGANVMALATMVQPADCVVCSEWAHIAVDETGAPERALGAKLTHAARRRRQARAPSSSTTCGTCIGVPAPRAAGRACRSRRAPSSAPLYTPDEVAALCDAAHSMGMTRAPRRRAHRQRHRGARRHRRGAAHRSPSTPASTWSASAAPRPAWRSARPSCTSNPALATRAKYVRKQVNQLPSKMRFVAAQFNALLARRPVDPLAAALERDGHAACTTRPRGIAGRGATTRPPEVNSVFPMLPARRDRAAAGLVLLLGLGRQPQPGALDDGVGHHRATTSTASPPECAHRR